MLANFVAKVPIQIHDEHMDTRSLHKSSFCRKSGSWYFRKFCVNLNGNKSEIVANLMSLILNLEFSSTC